MGNRVAVAYWRHQTTNAQHDVVIGINSVRFLFHSYGQSLSAKRYFVLRMGKSQCSQNTHTSTRLCIQMLKKKKSEKTKYTRKQHCVRE